MSHPYLSSLLLFCSQQYTQATKRNSCTALRWPKPVGWQSELDTNSENWKKVLALQEGGEDLKLSLLALVFPRTGRLANCNSDSAERSWNCRLGRDGSWVDSSPFVRMVVGSNLALIATYGPWTSKSFTRSCLWRFVVKLRHSIRAVSGAPLSIAAD